MEQSHAASQEIPTFYGIRMFITDFTKTRHWSVSSATFIQSILSHHIFLRSILILSSHQRLGLPSVLFLSGFPTKILWISHHFHPCYILARLILLDLIAVVIFGEMYKL